MSTGSSEMEWSSMEEFAADYEVLHPHQSHTVLRAMPPTLWRPTFKQPFAAPIDDLPTEILAMAFKYLRGPTLLPDPSQCGYIHDGKFASYQPLINVALVCRRWLDIVSNCSSLWTEIEGNTVEEAPVLLRLSRAAPISLRFGYLLGGMQARDRLGQLILGLHHRTRRLDLTAANDRHLHEAIRLADVDMPILQSLSLNAQCAVESAIIVSSAMRCPRLEAVVLRGIMWIPSHPLPRLTHLYLSNVKVPASNLLHLLNLTPALEVMELRHMRAFFDDGSQVPSPRLARLHTFIVSDCPIHVAQYIIFYCDTPNLAVITLLQQKGVKSTGLLLPPRWRPVRPMTNLTLYIPRSQPSVHVELNDAQGGELTMSWNLCPKEMRIMQAPASFPTMFPYAASITHFRVSYLRMHALKEILPHLQLLRSLVVTHMDSGEWNGMRGQDVEKMAPFAPLAQMMLEDILDVLNTEAPIMLPNLVSLSLHVHMNWRRMARDFVRMLGKRDREGRRIKTVSIKSDDFMLQGQILSTKDYTSSSPSGILDHVDEVEFVERAGDEGIQYNQAWKEQHGRWRVMTRA